jgi:hypothetical protein
MKEKNRFVTGNKWCVHAKQEGPTPRFGFSGTRDDLATIIALYSSINLILVVAKLILSSRLLGSSNGASVIKKSENGDFPAKIEPCQSCVYRSADIKSIPGWIGSASTKKIKSSTVFRWERY